MSQQNKTNLPLGRPYKFLIVDDSLFARKNIAKVVESIGGVVAGEASNGREAIEKYNELKPDLVLLDVSMPEMEGLEALTKIKEQDKNAKVVMVSSLGYEELVKKAIALGAEHFIAKPFQSGSAALVIKFVLEQEGEKP